MNTTIHLALAAALALVTAPLLAQEPAPPPSTAPAPGPQPAAPAKPAEAPPAPASPVPPSEGAASDVASLQKKVDELDQKLRVSERRWEIEQEQLAERKAEEKKNPPGLAVAYGKDGAVAIKSADDKFSFRFRPIVQADARFFKQGGTDTFLLRRVRPVMEGTVFQYFDWRIMPELAGTPNIQDAYVNIRLVREVQLRAGKYKPPVGIERLASDTDLPLVERGLSTSLVPDRDVGIQLHGEILFGTVIYAAGVFNGVDDGVNGDVDNNDAKDLVGRLFLHPF